MTKSHAFLMASACAWSSVPTLAETPDAPSSSPKPVDFNRQVRSILSDNCFYCHGPDKAHREADLRLDVREAALEAAVIVPGKPEESELVFRITSDLDVERMPPPAAHKTLTVDQIDLLTRWIAEGAEYQEHWAYQTLDRPEVPGVEGAEAESGPIDAFVLARLKTRGLSPSAEADRRTLIRRLSLDLTGLPPKPEEVGAFVDDEGPGAYERLVDRLLASPRYGERMAVPWLDVARYADTVGFHGDQNQNTWAYRDYVIKSFNENTPFDRFTIEQLAGDLLPGATDEQRMATCFNRLNMMTREGGAQAREYLAKYAADRVRTVGMAWLGSTIGCAECHDHKFDPILTRDFYALGAFFADVKQWGVYSDYSYTPNPDLRGYNNEYPFPPEIWVGSDALHRRIERLTEQVRQTALDSGLALERDPGARGPFDAWRTEVRDLLARDEAGWQVLKPSATSAEPTTKGKKARKEIKDQDQDGSAGVSAGPDGTIVFRREAVSDDEFRARPGAGWLASIRVEVLPDPEHDDQVLRGGASTATLKLSASVGSEGEAKPRAIGFRHAQANRSEPRYDSGSEIPGIQGGWKVDGESAEPLVGVWTLDRPIRLTEDDSLVLAMTGSLAGAVRISISPLAPEVPDGLALPTDLAGELEGDGNPTEDVLLAYLVSTAWDADAFRRLAGLDAEIIASRGGRTPVLVTEAWEPRVARVLPRGNWQDETGAIVEPAVPRFLPQPERASGEEDARLTRLDLARWLVGPENPLTARVIVNRFWAQFFGIGLSAQLDDVGAQGEPPSHPELLDWLAVEFRDGGWDIKKLVKQIVMSAAYRRGTNPPPGAAKADPDNRLLSHQNPRRLEAEFVRDNVLAIAGLIHLEPGGPPSKPYQPAGYYANIQFPDRRYDPEDDARQYRRGVYMHWQRTFLHPMLANFDAPSREDCIAVRTRANSPQQALTLLNDPSFVEAARALAARLLDDGAPADDAARLDLAFRRAVARPVTSEERESLLEFLEAMRAAYADRPDDAKALLRVGLAPGPDDADPIELAAWTSVCRVVLNLHETITRY